MFERSGRPTGWALPICMSSSSKSSKSSGLPTSGAARPYSFRPQDFGAPERVEKGASAALDEAESDDRDEGSSDSSTRARDLSSGVSSKVVRKEEHTILMAVPPPAQENKGD